ncbi:MmgE/PrpD family protein [Candidatus Pantoea multigeneris]|uniref:MmgE/PrpD family protein n=1 Tax=Candidatus Pantoea multigeneris TaxID=2608357 RepID=A0ABX0RAL5_9GAMM|nr:MmgE/PrpD family protein [Pantoea multigeneris]
MSLTSALVKRILFSEPDAEARQHAQRGVIDYIAVTWPVLRGHVPDSSLPALRSVYHDGSARSLALLWGYAGHALDYDDFHADFRGHPSVAILPALFAMVAHGQRTAVSHLLDAYAIGIEVAGRLGLAASQQHYALGYHNTASQGTIVAAAALARLLQLSEDQTAALLGIAATQASGLRAQFGSAIKPLHAGLAAERAVASAQLVMAGIEGQKQGVIEAFLAATGNGQQQPEKLIEHWGAPWRIVSPGLEFKPFATCGGTHSAAEAARILRREWLASGHSLESLLAQIVHIDVSFPPGGDLAASVRKPNSGIEARFSLEYVIAAMLIYDDLRLQDFAEGDVNPAVIPLAGKVHRHEDMSAPPDALNPSLRFHEVAVTLQSGEKLICRRTRQQSVAVPVDVEGKLQQAVKSETAEKAEQLLQACRLETDEALVTLVNLLR